MRSCSRWCVRRRAAFLPHVAADPRMVIVARNADVRDLIVASMPPCAEAMRAMIEAHDRLYGEGSGEAFFMGPISICCRSPSSSRSPTTRNSRRTRHNLSLQALSAGATRLQRLHVTVDDRQALLLDDLDHFHVRRIDDNHLVLRNRILERLGRRHVGDNVGRQRIELD